MIARVIVNHNSRAVDKLYDYFVPDEFLENAKIGSRVIVPFGKGNQKKEGYIFSVEEQSNSDKLKSIIEFSDMHPVFDEKTRKLILWMREKYLCTFMDIIKVIIPSGTIQKTLEYLVVNDGFLGELSKKEEDFLNHLKTLFGDELLVLNFQSEKNIISSLLKKGAIKKDYKKQSTIKDKCVKTASLKFDEKSTRELIESLKKKNAYRQAKVLDVLIEKKEASIPELLSLSGASHQAVSSLLKKGVISVYEKVIGRNPFYKETVEKKEDIILTEEQTIAYEKILSAIDEGKKKTFLLHGVTGSGKTEVYSEAIAEALKKGKKAIVLVPEISLTPQTLERFKRRFGHKVAIFHSGLSMGERYDQWKKMKEGDADIVIGARSAIFAPMKNVGIIVMDEEHEQSYKSDTAPRYHTREVAEFIAKENDAILVLASATPSVESYYKAKTGEYEFLSLKNRINKNAMPNVLVVDMREELKIGNKSIFSRELLLQIEENLKNKEQTILFLNRRGFSSFVSCRKCGYVAKCPDCNISLTYHKFDDKLRCHYCGYEMENPTLCPSCKSKYIRYFGGGTQRVEEEIREFFPDATTIRMDVDTTKKKFGHEKILEKFVNEKIDILIGTQMVAKGLDFENVTLVGVVSADVILNLDDFRSSERGFSILEQVTGRAGRRKKQGRAVVQTYSPENSAIEFMKKHSYEEFYDAEIMMRKALFYPPYSKMILVMFSHHSFSLVKRCALFFKNRLISSENFLKNVKILGPNKSPIEKIKNKYRYQLIIKCEDDDMILPDLKKAYDFCKDDKNYSDVTIVIDKNPNGVI